MVTASNGDGNGGNNSKDKRQLKKIKKKKKYRKKMDKLTLDKQDSRVFSHNAINCFCGLRHALKM